MTPQTSRISLLDGSPQAPDAAEPPHDHSVLAETTRNLGSARVRLPRRRRRRRASRDLAREAACSALLQHVRGDGRSLRTLYRKSYSFLRYFHHRWAPEAA